VLAADPVLTNGIGTGQDRIHLNENWIGTGRDLQFLKELERDRTGRTVILSRPAPFKGTSSIPLKASGKLSRILYFTPLTGDFENGGRSFS